VHSHGKGVLHCDLKPANVLLDQDSKPRLADFGQSRLSHEQEPALGTLFYMAPEQADLQAVPDARWDVYALGAVLYCMLTGQPPHRSDVAASDINKEGGLEKRLAAYRTLVVSAPRPTDHRRVSGVDRELADILDRCLETKPHRRFPNVQVVLGALEARSLRRARRPLLVMGAIGPALLLVIVSLFALSGFHTAVSEAERIQVQGALETNRFASRFVAETVAEKIDGRWNAIEKESAQSELQELLTAATGHERDHPTRMSLQARVEQIAAKLAHMDPASLVVYDQQGVLLARAPYNPAVIDRNYAYRDYFHGKGQDLKPGTVGLKPIQSENLSNVFVSTSSKKLVVSFSVPIWNGPSDLPEHEVIGVLSMTVNLGEFAELRGDPGRGAAQQLAVLVDSRPVSPLFKIHQPTRGKGAILEHSGLAEYFDKSEKIEPVYLAPDRVAELESMRASSDPELLQRNPLAAGEPNYIDAMAKVDPNYAGRWLAAAHPVFIEGRGRGSRDVGWAVLIQERYAAAAAPVNRLKQGLVRRGLIAAAVVVFVLTGLWGFVMIGLNDASRSRIASALRRKAGVKTVTPSSSTGGSGSAASARSSAELAATQLMQPPPEKLRK
ncbi:MAG: protein kinase, partial [Pirellulales bacterium]